MKKVFAALVLSFSSSIFAANFFSGDAGICASFINKGTNKFDPALYFSGFFAGQFSLTNALSFRTDLSLRTSDLFVNGLTKDAESVFRINELSAEYIKSFAGATHALTVFKGSSESVGTQHFIRRRLGAERYSSFLTENYLGLNAPNAYDIHGNGGSYSLTLKSLPVSAGLCVSKNTDVPGEAELNGDFRLACAFRYLTMDFLIGSGAPIYTQNDAGEDVFLLIDTLYLHSGVDMLIGNSHTPLALYILGGFNYLPVKKNDKTTDLKPKDIFVLAEPRISVGKVKIHLSAYNIPDEKLANFLFIEENIGANIRIFSDSLYTKNHDFSAGLSANAGLTGKYIDDLKSLESDDIKDNLGVTVSPFAEIQANKGLLRIMLQANAIKLKDEKPDAVKLHIGYKKEL